MTVNRTIWIPLGIGAIAGALTALASITHFLIPIGDHTSVGIGEIFTTLSAALGGPLAVLSMLLVAYGGVIAASPGLFPDVQAVWIMLADGTAHLGAMLVVVFIYTRLVAVRAKTTAVFLAGWWLTLSVYYLTLLSLSIFLIGLVSPGHSATFPPFADFMPEFLGTALITSLIWLAAPAHFRRPRWRDPQPATAPKTGIRGQ